MLFKIKTYDRCFDYQKWIPDKAESSLVNAESFEEAIGKLRNYGNDAEIYSIEVYKEQFYNIIF